MNRPLIVFLIAGVLVTGVVSAAPEDEVRAELGNFIAVQNAHDFPAVRGLLHDGLSFLWVTHGIVIWSQDAL